MRNFQTLDTSHNSTDNVEFFTKAADDDQPRLALRREGIYITISASYGPMEVALRPRYEEFVRALSKLSVVEGLHTTRQVGTGQAHLALGLTAEDDLLLRLTIVADATGHISLNLRLTKPARDTLYSWLNVPVNGSKAG
ncbi:MAG TPA: hypothetical protein PLD47_14370 [Aggregatilineales bacterium]|nr:hypothetical protein [Anaerolineales bacterium]HRE48908.1 hypothetical protein [Aggregatilineales bacterium]